MNPTLNILKDPRSKKLEEIYARIPKLECQRKCQMACGLIRSSGAIEDERLYAQTGGHFGEMRPSRARVVFDGNDFLKPRLYCSFLSDPLGDCTVYALRPLMCRLFGVTRELECPYGCQPERFLDHFEVQELIRLVAAL